MATAKAKQRSFTVTGRVNIEVAVDILAENLAEAVTKAEELKVSDFVEHQGDYYDGSLKIISVYQPGFDVEKGLKD